MEETFIAPAIQSRKRVLRSCCWAAAIILIGLPVLLLAITCGFMAIHDSRTHTEAQALITEIESSGLALSPESQEVFYLEETDESRLNQWRDVLDQLAEDSFYTESFELPMFAGNSDPIFPAPGDPWVYREPTTQFLGKHNQLYQSIADLCIQQLEPRQKHVRFPREYRGIDQLDDWHALSNAARLIALHGRLEIDRKNWAAIRSDITAILGCSRVASPNVNFVAGLIHKGINGRALDLLEDALANDAVLSTDIDALLPLLQTQCDIRQSWRTLVAGETSFGLQCYDNPELMEVSKVPFRSGDKLFYLTSMRALMNAPCGDHNDFYLTTDRSFEEQIDTIAESPWQLFNSLYSLTFLPSNQTMVSAELNRVVRTRALVIAMRLRIFERENGRMPASIAEIGDVDLTYYCPAGGEQFGYQRVEDEAILWWDYQFGPTPETPPVASEDDVLERYSQIRLRLATP